MESVDIDIPLIKSFVCHSSWISLAGRGRYFGLCFICRGVQGGGSPGEHGAGGVRETGKERQERPGSGISTRAGSGREIQKGKRLQLLFFHCL